MILQVGLGFWWWKSMLGFGMSCKDLGFRDSFFFFWSFASFALGRRIQYSFCYSKQIMRSVVTQKIPTDRSSNPIDLCKTVKYICNWCYIYTHTYINNSFLSQQKDHKKYNFLLVLITLLFPGGGQRFRTQRDGESCGFEQCAHEYQRSGGTLDGWIFNAKNVAWWFFEVAFWGRKLGA